MFSSRKVVIGVDIPTEIKVLTDKAKKGDFRLRLNQSSLTPDEFSKLEQFTEIEKNAELQRQAANGTLAPKFADFVKHLDRNHPIRLAAEHSIDTRTYVEKIADFLRTHNNQGNKIVVLIWHSWLYHNIGQRCAKLLEDAEYYMLEGLGLVMTETLCQTLVDHMMLKVMGREKLAKFRQDALESRKILDRKIAQYTASGYAIPPEWKETWYSPYVIKDYVEGGRRLYVANGCKETNIRVVCVGSYAREAPLYQGRRRRPVY